MAIDLRTRIVKDKSCIECIHNCSVKGLNIVCIVYIPASNSTKKEEKKENKIKKNRGLKSVDNRFVMSFAKYLPIIS